MSGVLRDQRDDARHDEQDKCQGEVRGVDAHHTGCLVGQGRQPDPRGVSDCRPVHAQVLGDLAGACVQRGDGPGDEIEDPREHVAEDQREEDRDAAGKALEPDGHEDKYDHHRQRHPLVLGPVGVGHDGREVETEQHHHRAGDDGREDCGDHAAAHDVHDDAHHEQARSSDEHRAGDLCTGATLGADRGDGADKGDRGAEVAGDLPLDHGQEQEGAHAGEENRQLRVKAHDDREHECRPEHGHHVLGTDPDGARPAQPFHRCHDLAGLDVLAVAVDLPRCSRCPTRHGYLPLLIWTGRADAGR